MLKKPRPLRRRLPSRSPLAHLVAYRPKDGSWTRVLIESAVWTTALRMQFRIGSDMARLRPGISPHLQYCPNKQACRPSDQHLVHTKTQNGRPKLSLIGRPASSICCHPTFSVFLDNLFGDLRIPKESFMWYAIIQKASCSGFRKRPATPIRRPCCETPERPRASSSQRVTSITPLTCPS